MSLFNRGPKPRDYQVVRDRCWSDPTIDSLYEEVTSPSRSAEEKVRLVLQHLASVRADSERRVYAVNAVSELLVDHVELVRAATAPTADRAADADAKALLSAVLVMQAWNVRGEGVASTVSTESAATFHQILEEAEEVGYAALELDPQNPIAGVARLRSGRGLGLPVDEWWSRFDVARRAKPTLYLAHTAMLQTLCGKWYGNHDLMFDFARKVAADAPVGDPVGAVLAIAHVEYLLVTQSLSVPPEDLALARQAADRWIAGGEQVMAAHPAAFEAHQLFGWLLREDLARRRFHLSRSQGRMSVLPWAYLKGEELTYRRLMASAKVR